MSRPVLAIALALAVLMTALAVAMVSTSQPKPSHQLHKAYWPFSVETTVRDR